jgi:EAL domain-containing protein (putative c-di-GMP-specific phosphodiesterase class I)
MVFDTSMRIEDKRRIALMADMPDGLERGDFRLVYQPILQLEDGALLGFEALCRWQHEAYGAVPPDVFIPIAEEVGFIGPLGNWVLQTACTQMFQWVVGYGERAGQTMSVNVSAAQLSDGSLPRQVERALRVSGLAPEHLRLEITESVVLDDSINAAHCMEQLRVHGVTFSLDDFGSGYSSLSYLNRLDYDALKIDRSFLGADTPGQTQVLKAIVTLAHALGMQVVAEGVESAEQCDTLRKLGCDAGQGYFFAEPLERDSAHELIRSGHHSPRASG